MKLPFIFFLLATFSSFACAKNVANITSLVGHYSGNISHTDNSGDRYQVHILARIFKNGTITVTYSGTIFYSGSTSSYPINYFHKGKIHHVYIHKNQNRIKSQLKGGPLFLAKARANRHSKKGKCTVYEGDEEGNGGYYSWTLHKEP